MYKSFSMELAGRTLTVDVGRVGAQANGCAFMHYGDTTVLSLPRQLLRSRVMALISSRSALSMRKSFIR